MKELKEQVNQYKALLCLLVGVVLLIVSYLYGFNSFNTKKSDINDEIDTLNTQYTHLKQMYDNKDSYVEKTNTLTSDYDKLIDNYDADITNESVLMDSVTLEEKTKATVTSLGMADNEMIYAFGALTSSNPDNAKVTGIHSDYAGISNNYTMTVVGSYNEIKDVLSEVLENDRRKVPTATSFTFDTSTGDITLNLSISEYAITGKDRKPSAVTIPTVQHAVDNIFYNGFIGAGDAQ